MTLPLDAAPDPDPVAEPGGYMVTTDGGERIHYLDWGAAGRPGGPSVIAIHGLSSTAWGWTPVARRVRGVAPFVAMDLRGHGLSDAPTEPDAYALDVLASDVVAVAEGTGRLDDGGRVVLAGHGFGAMVALAAAARLADSSAGIVLVDGGWESLEASTGVDVDEFLRGLDEPPEVMRSLPAFLADRSRFDPGTWDADQDRAARATVVETHAGRVVPATRPHALEACVRAMFDYDPVRTLPAVPAPIAALVAADDDAGTRGRALVAVSAARVAAGGAPIESWSFGQDGHNLMRYRPREVAVAIDTVDRRSR
jgi:pimeloyl-ACP methyl ester carboxylesterase